MPGKKTCTMIVVGIREFEGEREFVHMGKECSIYDHTYTSDVLEKNAVSVLLSASPQSFVVFDVRIPFVGETRVIRPVDVIGILKRSSGVVIATERATRRDFDILNRNITRG